MSKELWRVEEVAFQMSLSRPYVYRLIQEGRLPSVRFGRKAVRVRAADVEAFLATCQESTITPNPL